MEARIVIKRARESGRHSLTEVAAKRVLAEFGVPVPKSVTVAKGEDVDSMIHGLTPPFVVKVMSQDILHKSDAGGVVLNLSDTTAVREAVDRVARQPQVREARVDGYLVEEMSTPGRELVIGGVQDRQFGPMVMVGLGGIFVEILKDVAFRLCPITEHDAREMLAELRGSALLNGARGEAEVDQEAIVEILLRVGGEHGLLMELGSEIAELDLNPIIATQTGAIAADARIILTRRENAETKPSAGPFDELPVLQRFRPLFEPKTVAVLGASSTGTTIANTFIRRMKQFGYRGTIYPVHPKASEIEGLRCYRSVSETPEEVDYAYIAVAAKSIPDILQQAKGRVRFAQVISSGYGEVSEGVGLQSELVVKAHAGGCRVIGPNSLGLYSPRGHVTFPVGASTEVGGVGVVSQSGGLGTDIIKRGQWRGLRYSGVVTVGNSADLGPVDLLEFYLEDPLTTVVGMYLEDIRHGRRFFDLLRSTNAGKPVVILRGGRSLEGRAAAASHTGAMAGEGRAWDAVTKQTGCVLVKTLDQFLDALLALQFLKLHPERPTRRVVLFGNGGGTSVLAADIFAEKGLSVSAFGSDTKAQLDELNLPPGTSVANPIDTPVATLQEQEGRIADAILDIVCRSAAPEAVVMHLNLAAFVGRGSVDPIENLIQAVVRMQTAYSGRTHFLLVLRVDGSPELEERRRSIQQKALAVGIPVYGELVEAANALSTVSAVERSLAH